MSSIPTNPDALLTREQTSEALKESGFPNKPSTLATKASRGGGPPFHKFGARVLYRWGDALAWAQSRLSAPRRNTSEGDAIGHAARAESEPPTSAETRPIRRAISEAESRASDKAMPCVKSLGRDEATARRRPRLKQELAQQADRPAKQ
jgi:hypothetical protein